MTETIQPTDPKTPIRTYIFAGIFWLILTGGCVWTGLSALTECFGRCRFYDWTINGHTACDHPEADNDVLRVDDITAQSIVFYSATSDDEVDAVYTVDNDNAVICAVNREWENEVSSWDETGNFRLFYFDVYDEAAVFRHWFLTNMETDATIWLAPFDSCCFEWSPDETKIGYVVRPSGVNVGTLSVYDTQADTFTDVASNVRLLTWLPSGEGLVYATSDEIGVTDSAFDIVQELDTDSASDVKAQQFIWLTDTTVQYGESCVVDVVALTIDC